MLTGLPTLFEDHDGRRLAAERHYGGISLLGLEGACWLQTWKPCCDECKDLY